MSTSDGTPHPVSAAGYGRVSGIPPAPRRGSWGRFVALAVVVALAVTAAVVVRLHTARPTQTFVALDLRADAGGVQPLRFGGADLSVTDVVWTSWTVDRADGTGTLHRTGAPDVPV